MATAGDQAFEPHAWFYDQAKFKHLPSPELGTLHVMSRRTGELGSFCPATGHVALTPPASSAGGAGRKDKTGSAGSLTRRVSFAEDFASEGSTAVPSEDNDFGSEGSVAANEQSCGGDAHWKPGIVDFPADLVFVPCAEEDHDDCSEDRDSLEPGNRLAPAAFVYDDFDLLVGEHTFELDVDGMAAHIFDYVSV